MICAATSAQMIGAVRGSPPPRNPANQLTQRQLTNLRAPRRREARSAHVTSAIKASDHAEIKHSVSDAHVQDQEQYAEMYARSLEDPNGFWRDLAMQDFHWETPIPEQHHSYNFDVRKGPVFTEWFKGGKTNIAYNCLDRHVGDGHGAQPCFLFEGNDVGVDGAMSYQQVLEEVCRVANFLRSVGVKKGDSVAIYMPMVCELPIAMLACARIGAVHSVVFGGFSSDALASRIEDCKARVLLTCNAVKRGPKVINLKQIADRGCEVAVEQGFNVEHVLVYANDSAESREDTHMVPGRDAFWQDVIPQQASTAEVEWMDSEDTLFYLYTSGSTGKPKGVVHSTGGFMTYAATTFKYVFAAQPGDVYWCTADCGWITGHSYMTYGPLLNRATQVVFEGVPTYPDAGRCWQIVDKYQVKQFYTAPTAIRSLMRSGAEWVTKYDRSSLRVLGSVGEPINPEAWRWYHEVVGDGRCPIVDTWWQTETGGHMITPLPGAWSEKPGSASLPFFGVKPVLVDEKGQELEGEAEGYLCISQSWPSNIRTVYRDHERYETTYFAPFPGTYFTGDGARRDSDGYYWITGRVDDVINVSGHRIGTAEVESALVAHPQCAEAAVVGYEHPVKGQGIWAYVTLMEGVDSSDSLRKELVMSVRSQIGAFAAPDVIHWAPGLPKTRSGKIMRRVLRKIASFEEDQLGDTSTLADPGVVASLLELRGK
ncbi:hypothetical protein D9Q98_002145 [Chlorella vulgaris]|uniref:Acetyl-coenzyme A synthetase n=1 Tax=Chlorella vulgaris TaxID=3077 RepID=A0A9D4TX31_CHLVU|nr:hypothetical protein D9Q98_002145 [Chlorella vulgaris]